jgi:hypothetical protein
VNSKSTNSIKQKLRQYLAEHQPPVINEIVWLDLLSRLAPVSESYLRDLLRDTGIPFDQPYAGIRQHTFDDLERSLREMLAVYQKADGAGDRHRARLCRRQVIAAKDRARFLARNPRTPAAKRALKEEMAEWMVVWLENPEVFPAWIEARKREMNKANQSEDMKKM